MSQELKTFTVNLKSLDQDISDPIVAGGGDAAGRTFRVIFDQEAEAQITDETKVYLSWFHRQTKVKGYNVFTQTSEDPITWEIKWPQAMLTEGDVLCCIELVDSVSIAQSTNFLVHILSDPNDGSQFVVSDDFTLFQNAVIRLNCIGNQMKDQMVQQKIEFEDMLLRASKWGTVIEEADKAAKNAETVAKETKEIADKTKALADKIETNFDSKADKDSVYTKEETDTTIKELIQQAGHLMYQQVDTLPTAADAQLNTIYLVPKAEPIEGETPDENQYHDEYIVYTDTSGEKHYEKIGDTKAILTIADF